MLLKEADFPRFEYFLRPALCCFIFLSYLSPFDVYLFKQSFISVDYNAAYLNEF